MGAQKDSDDNAISAGLLSELHDQAQVLDVVDEGHDIALDLHTELFNPSTRERALKFLQSPRYETAAEKFRRLVNSSEPLSGGDAA